MVLTACSTSSSSSGTATTPANQAGAPAASGSGSSAQPAPSVGSVAIQSAGADPMNPADPVVVRATNATLTAVTVTNAATGAQVQGRLSADKTTWTSTQPLGYHATYQVGADASGKDGRAVHQAGTVTTINPKVQAFPSFIPPPSQQDVGVGQPIVVKFDHDITDKAAAEKALSVKSVPAQVGGWLWLNKREVHYRPQVYWQAGTTVTLTANVYGVNLGGGTYGQLDRQETFRIHDSWIAKADGKTEQMQIFHNGQLTNTMPISLGAPGFPTHEGPHVISDKQPSVIMDSCTYGVCPGQPGYYREKVDLDERISNDGEFVHSAPWSVGQQGNSNVSHGCVNAAPVNAKWFFDHFGIGDVVDISNSGGQRLQMGDNYGDWELSWAQWQAGSALR